MIDRRDPPVDRDRDGVKDFGLTKDLVIGRAPVKLVDAYAERVVESAQLELRSTARVVAIDERTAR